MKFAVGYQQPEHGDPFTAIVADYRTHIEEVYFPWIGIASGRAPLGDSLGGRDWQAQSVLENDLATLRGMNIRLDLLFNANCYGGRALSIDLENEVGSIIAHLDDICGLPDVVTTASPMIARTVKKHFPSIETRASVNLRIGNTRAMGYVGDLFDSFCLQRDRQRDPAVVGQAHAWCRLHGKRLCLLVNSGCLRDCPGQTFHDNAVAHDAEIACAHNIRDWNQHVCWRLYSDPERMVEFLKGTWIRPEDLRRYENVVDLCKLATRQHTNPRMVIDAYTRGTYNGDVMNLMEPCFASAFAPRYLDNASFPIGWADRTARCGPDCGDCDYCRQVLDKALKTYPEFL